MLKITNQKEHWGFSKFKIIDNKRACTEKIMNIYNINILIYYNIEYWILNIVYPVNTHSIHLIHMASQFDTQLIQSIHIRSIQYTWQVNSIRNRHTQYSVYPVTLIHHCSTITVIIIVTIIIIIIIVIIIQKNLRT